jgi:DNA polymerase-1
MIPYFFDTETYPIRPGLLAPPLVCLQDEDGIHVGDGAKARVVRALEGGLTFGAHNAPYDMAVICAQWPDLTRDVWRAYEEDRVLDTEIDEILRLIDRGDYGPGQKTSLAACCERHGIDHGYHVDASGAKAEPWRVRYAELVDVPIQDWPADAVRYATLDVKNLRALFEAQGPIPPDAFRQSRARWWLHLASCWGMKTDPAAVEAFARKVEEEHGQVRARLALAGLVRGDGTKDTKAAAARMEEACRRAALEVPRTETGKAGLDADACRATGDAVLVDYARYTSIAALRSRAWRMAAGTTTPIQPRFNVLVDTGRTSCSKGEGGPTNGDQVQNVHREPGVRECYVPRPGWLYLSADWSSAEMHTFAQAMRWQQGYLGELGRTLNAGKDPHVVLGSDLAGVPYDDLRAALKGPDPARRAWAKGFRQMAKAGNFGFPGGMGISKFRLYAAATYDVILSEEEAAHLKRRWMARYPETARYFRDVDQTLATTGDRIVHHKSERARGRVSYCAACNSYFQGLAADMAKDAGFRISRECYLGPGPLHGSRIVNFIHDEFLLEVPDDVDRADAAARRVIEIMEEAGREWCPDVPVRAEPALMRRWSKAAEPVRDSAGRLVVWNPS